MQLGIQPKNIDQKVMQAMIIKKKKQTINSKIIPSSNYMRRIVRMLIPRL